MENGFSHAVCKTRFPRLLWAGRPAEFVCLRLTCCFLSPDAGGTAVILGRTGKNFGAGASGLQGH